MVDQEKKCEYLKQQAVIAEEKERQALLDIEKAAASIAAKLQANSEDSVFSDESESSYSEDHPQVVLHMNKVVAKGIAIHILV